jgi:cobalt-zinc-cadmium efflux system outer membrane protein
MKTLSTAAATLVLVALCGTASARAQAARPAVIDAEKGLTLEEAIAEGLRAEPEMAAARFEIDAARGDRRQAALRPNPMVGFDQREQMQGMDRQTSVEVDWPLDAFRRGPRIATADRAIEVAQASVRDRERLLAAAIRDRYGEVLTSLRRLEIADAVLAANRTTYELLRSRAAEGAAPPLERDIALVELRRLLGERELALGRLVTNLADLNQLLGRPPSAVLTLRAPLDVVVRAVSATGAPSAPTDRPDVVEAAAQVSMAQARMREAAQERKPEVSLFGAYMRMNEAYVSHNLSAGVRLSVPIFNRGQGLAIAAQARERAAAERLRARHLAVATEVAAAGARVEAARAAMSTYSEETRTLAQRNLEVVRETYALGRATLFDVLSEQRRFLEFESAHTEALAEMFSAQAALRRAIGEVK